LTREVYSACVTDVATQLNSEGLLTDEAKAWYIKKAKTDEIGTY